MKAIPVPRVAIVGAGMIGAVHVRAARDAGAEVIGVLGSSAASSAEAAARWRLPRAYADIADLIADKPDFVHICSPNATHADYARAAAGAGLHIVIEKPVATHTAEAEALERDITRAGVIATVPYVYRYHPMARELRARRQAGEFGDVLLVHGSYLQDWLLSPDASSWRVDPAAGGASRAFADIGSHWCDLAEFISGERFVAVQATLSIAHPARPAASGVSFGGASASAERLPVHTEDIALATFRTSRGIYANTVISQVSAGRKNRLWLEIDGTRHSAAFNQEAPESVWIGAQDGAFIVRRAEGAPAADQARLNRTPPGHAQGWTDAFAAFCADTYAAARGEKPEGLPMLADGVRSTRIIDAVLASASAHAWTEIAT